MEEITMYKEVRQQTMKAVRSTRISGYLRDVDNNKTKQLVRTTEMNRYPYNDTSQNEKERR